MVVNGLLVLTAGSVATLLATRPQWVRRQRRVAGTMLGGVALLLARDVASPARVV